MFVNRIQLRGGAVGALAAAAALMFIVIPHHTNAGLRQEVARPSAPTASPDQPRTDQDAIAFKASFQELVVSLEGLFAGKTAMTIGADGAIECALTGRGVTDYQSRFRLRPAALRELEKTLELTDWLTEPLLDKGRMGVTDATYVSVALTRNGQQRAVRFDLLSPEPYRSLGVFLWRLRQQEQMQAELTASSTRNRVTGSTHLIQALDQRLTSRMTVWDLPLDFDRFVPAMDAILASPDDRDGEELVAASRLMAALKTVSQRAHLENLARNSFSHRKPDARLVDGRVAAIRALRDLGIGSSLATLEALSQDPSPWIRGAVAEALETVPPDNAIPILTNMTANTRPAAWTLIRLGQPAVPAIVGVLCLNEHEHKETGPYRLVREYCEHWDEIPKPLDPQVLRALRRRVEFGLAADYGLKLLELAGQPFKPINARRTLERFLSGVAAADAQELEKVGRVHLRDNAPGGLLEKAKAGRLQVERCCVDGASAWAIVADSQDTERVYFVWMNQESGRTWEITAARRMTTTQADRELQRKLKGHPAANEIPAEPEAPRPGS